MSEIGKISALSCPSFTWWEYFAFMDSERLPQHLHAQFCSENTFYKFVFTGTTSTAPQQLIKPMIPLKNTQIHYMTRNQSFNLILPSSRAMQLVSSRTDWVHAETDFQNVFFVQTCVCERCGATCSSVWRQISTDVKEGQDRAEILPIKLRSQKNGLLKS